MLITDKIMKASSGTRPNPTTLTALKGIGDAILSADDLTGWALDTPITFVLFKIDTSGNEILGTRSDWKGIVSGNTITQLTLTAGVDTIYPQGSPVIAAATARWADDLAAALLVSFNQNGTLKDSSVGAAQIGDGTITNAKLSTAAGELGAVWQSWTPTLTNVTIGNGTVAAAYKRVGKDIKYRIRILFGSTTSVSGDIKFSPPATPNAELYLAATEGYLVGQAKYLNATIAAFSGPVYVSSATTFNFAVLAPSGSFIGQANVNATAPFAFGTADVIAAEGFYEEA